MVSMTGAHLVDPLGAIHEQGHVLGQALQRLGNLFDYKHAELHISVTALGRFDAEITVLCCFQRFSQKCQLFRSDWFDDLFQKCQLFHT